MLLGPLSREGAGAGTLGAIEGVGEALWPASGTTLWGRWPPLAGTGASAAAAPGDSTSPSFSWSSFTTAALAEGVLLKEAEGVVVPVGLALPLTVLVPVAVPLLVGVPVLLSEAVLLLVWLAEGVVEAVSLEEADGLAAGGSGEATAAAGPAELRVFASSEPSMRGAGGAGEGTGGGGTGMPPRGGTKTLGVGTAGAPTGGTLMEPLMPPITGGCMMMGMGMGRDAEPLPSEPLPSEPLPSEPLPSEPLPPEPLPPEPLPSVLTVLPAGVVLSLLAAAAAAAAALRDTEVLLGGGWACSTAVELLPLTGSITLGFCSAAAT